MRKTPFINGEWYHIYNRGVDKRNIICDAGDSERFLLSITEFNVVEPIGSIHQHSFTLRRPTSKFGEPMVEFLVYCLNPNHFHFIVKQVVDGGISEFMKRMGGYSKFFNEKYDRSGALFQGKFKSVHINSNEYLLYLSAYVNLNNLVHRISTKDAALVRSSWDEYRGVAKKQICNKDIILGQFRNIKEYTKTARETVEGIIKRKYELDGFLLE